VLGAVLVVVALSVAGAVVASVVAGFVVETGAGSVVTIGAGSEAGTSWAIAGVVNARAAAIADVASKLWFLFIIMPGQSATGYMWCKVIDGIRR
jgi:hypothetical protein